METALALRQEGQVSEPNVVISLEDVKKHIAPNATDKELFFFMNISKSYGLNPFKREIHFVKYGNSPGQTVVGYESYIKRAERSGLLDGWGVELGKDQLGEKATITIYRKGRTKPFVWTVYRHEFDSGQANWKKMPLFMLRKVAISQGFRLAFPEEIGGMPYIPEEINGETSEKLPTDNENPEQEKAPEQEKPKTIPELKKAIHAKMKGKNLSKETCVAFFDFVKPSKVEEYEEFLQNFDAKMEAFANQKKSVPCPNDGSECTAESKAECLTAADCPAWE